MNSPGFHAVGNNKENVLRVFDTNQANISMTSLNNTLGFNQSISKLANESFDAELIPMDTYQQQLDAYEKQIKKLALDNVALRKRNKNLTDLARLKEEQLIESLDQQKKKAEENKAKSKRNFNYELDNYFQCFLQIESEKNCFKVKYEELQQQYEELKERMESLEAVDQPEEFEEPPRPKKLLKTPTINEEVEKISNQHVDIELFYVEEQATETFQKEKRRSQMLQVSKPPIDPAVLVDYKSEMESLQRQVEELEVEKKMFETKITKTEEALSRWVFKACNETTECKKLKEKISELEKERETYSQEMEQLRTDRDNSLKLFKLNQANLDDTKQILAETNAQLEKISLVNLTLETKNMEITERLAALENKTTCEMAIQTDSIETVSSHSQTEAPNTPSNKLTESMSTGHVANIAAKFNGRMGNSTSPVAVSTGFIDIDTAGLQNELKSVKQKNDHLLFEKQSLKSRNDELAQQNADLTARLEELGRESAELANYITTTIEKNDLKVVEKKPEKTVDPVPVTIKRMMKTTSQQTSHSHLKNNAVAVMTTQTSSSSMSVNVENLWKSRLDSCRNEMTEEMNKVKDDLAGQIKELEVKCGRLEAEIKEEKANSTKLSLLNKEISFNLSNKNEEYLQLQHAMEDQDNDYKKKKQIADTIIQQQKKLLDHMQRTGRTKNIDLTSIKKLKIPKTNKKSNPLLANLSKPSVPYKFSQSITTTNSIAESKTDILKTGTSSIEAELNSNYEAYETLNRIRRPPTTTAPPPPSQQTSIKQETTAQPSSAVIVKPFIQKPEANKNIHVFITGLNTFPVYCHVCQHLIPLIAYASKCQICSFTCHSQCSNLNKHKTGTNSAACHASDDLFKYCQTDYTKANHAYNNYVNKLIKTTSSVAPLSQHDKHFHLLLSDYLHMYVDGKWKRLWITLRIDGQLDLYQSRDNKKSFDNINLVNEKYKFETDYNIIKKLLAANYSSQLASATPASTAVPVCTGSYNKSEDSVNLYEQVDAATLQVRDFTTSLVILLYTPKTCVQLGFDSFSKKIIWLDALQSSCLNTFSIPQGIPSSSSSGNISKKSALMAGSTGSSESRFKAFNLERALNPFLELSDFLSINSFCYINDHLVALACDDGLYVSEPGAPSINGAPSLSLVKINTIESAHKLNHEFGKLCLIGRRSRQFLAIDVQDLLTAKVYHRNVNDESSQDEDEEDEEDEKLINVKIEHIHSIDRCHLFESTLTTDGNWYSAVATPETIFILLFKQNSGVNKFSLIKTINTQNDSPCLCLKFSPSRQQLIYGCTKEFYKMDLENLQSTPIIENLVNTMGKKIINDEDLLASSKKKKPISVCVISLSEQNENEAVLLCYEDYALILVFNSTNQVWQLQTNSANQQNYHQNSMVKKNSSTSISNTSANSSIACLKWPRGLPPLQIEYDTPHLYLFYNDMIIVYKTSFEDGIFHFKKSGIAFIYKPRFLSTMHLASTRSIIISNRRISPSTDSEATESRNIYYDTETEDGVDTTGFNIKSSPDSFEDEDRICLSHFTPYD